MQKIWQFAVLAVVVCILAGCAGPLPATYPDVATPGMPNVQLALNSAIQTTIQAQDQLDQIAVAPAAVGLPQVLPAELEKPVTWSYTGKLEPAVQALANSVGYQVQILGSPVGPPVPISVNIHDLPINDAFTAVAAEAQSQATVSVVPLNHVVQIQYKPPGGTHA
jgi:defect-in-organelle-trafficking protein DotD